MLNYTERLPSQTMGKSSLPFSHSRIIHCVIKSDSLNRGSLYLSGMKGVENLDSIKMLNVKSILSCSQGCKLNYTSDDISNYKYLPIPQDSIFSLNEYLRTVSQFIKESLENSNCIVHCQNGSNKSISVLMSFLMRYQSLSFNEALTYMKNKLKQVELDQKYQQALRQFEKHLKTNKQKVENLIKLNNSSISSRKSLNNKKLNESMDSKLDENPQNMDIKINKFDTSRRYKTSKSYINDQQIQLLQKQSKSKIKTQNPSIIKNQTNKSKQNQEYLTHKEAVKFDQVYSSSRIEYIGIKRQLKNSKSCFKKQKKHQVSFSPQSLSFQIYQPEDQIDYLTVQKDYNNKSRFSSRLNSETEQKLKTQRSQRNSYNKSALELRNGRERTKRTQQIENNKSFLKVLNPQHQQLSKSRVSHLSKSSKTNQGNKSSLRSQSSKLIKNQQVDISQIVGRQFRLSPSKRKHFEKINQQQNNQYTQMATLYETEMTNLRINYHNRLRHLRPTKKFTQQQQQQQLKSLNLKASINKLY